jgi:hypothetical protein
MIIDDGGSAIHLQSNSTTLSQMLFKKSDGGVLGRVYGSYNTTSGAKSFGFLDGDSQWSYLHTTNGGHNFYSNYNHVASIASNGAVRSRYPTDNSHYGYFEFVNSSNTRGGYLGYGNGGTVMNLYMDAADYLDIGGGHSIRYLSPTAYATMYFDNATSTKTGGIVYNGANQFVLGRYGNVFGSWEASPFIFDLATGKLTVNGLRVTSLANCGSGGKLTTDAAGNVYCGTDVTGSGRGINLTNCYNKTDNGNNDGWNSCGAGEVVTKVYVSGTGCGGDCVASQVTCCRVTVQ